MPRRDVTEAQPLEQPQEQREGQQAPDQAEEQRAEREQPQEPPEQELQPRETEPDREQQEQEQEEQQHRARLFESQGLTEDEAVERLRRDRGYRDDRPLLSHRDAFAEGYAGQTPDDVPNEAYTVSGQVTGEAAAQDRRAASRGRIDDVEQVRESNRSDGDE